MSNLPIPADQKELYLTERGKVIYRLLGESLFAMGKSVPDTLGYRAQTLDKYLPKGLTEKDLKEAFAEWILTNSTLPSVADINKTSFQIRMKLHKPDTRKQENKPVQKNEQDQTLVFQRMQGKLKGIPVGIEERTEFKEAIADMIRNGSPIKDHLNRFLDFALTHSGDKPKDLYHPDILNSWMYGKNPLRFGGA